MNYISVQLVYKQYFEKKGGVEIRGVKSHLPKEYKKMMSWYISGQSF